MLRYWILIQYNRQWHILIALYTSTAIISKCHTLLIPRSGSNISRLIKAFLTPRGVRETAIHIYVHNKIQWGHIERIQVIYYKSDFPQTYHLRKNLKLSFLKHAYIKRIPKSIIIYRHHLFRYYLLSIFNKSLE